MSKAYDRVNWVYLTILMTHVGLNLDFVAWVMIYIDTILFKVLVDVSTLPLFHA